MMIKFLVICIFSSSAFLSTVNGQGPVEISVQEIQASPSGPVFTDCITAPVITCPSTYFGCPGDDVDPDNTGFATALAGDVFCETPNVTYSDEIFSEGPCNGEIEIHRMWTATYPDAAYSFLFADCTQIIFLKDEDGPMIAGCPENVLTSPNENCEAIVTWTLPIATDICGLESLTSSHDSGDAFPQGETIVTYTATDLCGNTAICSFTVTVEGSCCFDPPTITCPDDYLGCPSDGLAVSATGEATAASASTMCGPVDITFDDLVISTGLCSGSTVVQRTWTASYINNTDLTSTCIQTITLADTKVPLITNVPADITMSPNDDCTAIVTWDDLVATDNCSIPELTSNFTSGSTFSEGVTEVEYTAIDACGNESTASFTITINSCCSVPPTIICPDDYNGCPDTNIDVTIESNCTATPTQYTGWAVATCNAEANTDDPVGVIYDIRNTANAPSAADWAPSITDIHPANWTLGQIGQIFGIAIGINEEVYLAASDIYDTGYNSDPFGPGQIFVAHANNGFLAQPFIDLPNTGGPLNGIGNIVYDRINHQLFASNLEDGKIYRIALDGSIIETYDPWSSDNGTAGIVAPSEQVWGIGLNSESGVQKLYFARIGGSTREMYSISLSNAAFPSVGSETIEISNILGTSDRIADIAFSDNGLEMIFAERGTKFTSGAHDAQMLNYNLTNGSWQIDQKYYVGSWVTEQYPNIVVDPGENSAGGVSFGPVDVNSEIEGCDQLVWTTMNYFRTDDGNLYYGMQGISVDGNNPNTANTNPNTETDIIIDFDGAYDNFAQKGDLGDVEVFQAGGALLAPETGIATATAGSAGCGTPIVTYIDDVVSEGPCDGATVINRTWLATDSENTDLSSTCTQVITLEDIQAPVISNIPSNITIAPNGDCQGSTTWAEPTAEDNCGLTTFTSDIASGSTFEQGTTTVTYTATDDCGLTSTASFTVTVSACCSAPPTIVCPQNHLDCIGTPITPSVTGTAVGTAGSSNCQAPNVTHNDVIVSTGPCDGAISIIRTWTATDPDNGLTATCDQSIILIDDKLPLITNTPSDITASPTDACTAVVTWDDVVATDNCSIPDLTSNFESGYAFSEGTTEVIYTATDDCGNVSTASFIVTITECCVSPPTIICPADHQDCIGTSIGTNVTGTAVGTAGSSTCQVPTVTHNDVVVSTGPCDGAISIIRTWTATDPDNGLTATCDQSIILIDDTPPVLINCPADITVETSTDESIVTWIEPTANDACSLEWVMGDYTPGDVFPIGSTTVTYTAIDDCGNVTPCSFVVTVESTGTITCNDDIVVECGGSSGTPITWNLPVIETGCTEAVEGDSIAGFIYMGSLNGSAYYCSTAPAASASANAIANNNGGYLATITSQEENDLLAGFLNTQCALIGLSDASQEGTFTWNNGEPLGYTNWSSNQPNNENGNQDCVLLCSNGWNDTQCEVAYEFIMEIPVINYEQTTGLPNGSVFPVGTDTITYVVTDACGTELTCSFTVTVEESVQLVCPNDHYFTCPAGATNVVAYWNTPELESCCMDCNSGVDEIDGYMYMGSFGGSKYYCSIADATWPAANSIAQSYGGHLAEINDAAENAFLANILTLQRAWIGLNDAAVEGNFKWSTGNVLTYNNWYQNQPSNTNNYQDYVSMLNDGQWNDEFNNLVMEYIMEIPCSSVTQIGGPYSGSSLPIGVTTITYAGMDACGNTDTCSFDITINGTTGCQSYGIDSWYTWIENFGFNDYSNPSGNNGGYEDFTDGECIEVVSGTPVPITLTPGFASSIYTMYWKIWIDYNHDGDYLDAGEYIAYGSGHQELNGIVNISSSCLLGETTMRVSMKYGAYPSGPCAIFSNGEVEDYCINISGNDGPSANGFKSSESTVEPVLLSSIGISNNFVSTDLEADIAADKANKARGTSPHIDLQVYPNPTTNILNIEAVGDEKMEFVLVDSEGKKAINAKLDFSKGRQSIDLSGLPNGIYLLRSLDGKHTRKVLVQR